MDEICKIIGNWKFDSTIKIQELKATGAAIALKCWSLGNDYTLKKGDNFKGLQHHITISKELMKYNLNASVPLKTRDGKDYLDCGKYYYVITQNTEKSFLSTKITPAEEYNDYISFYKDQIYTLKTKLEELDNNFIDKVVRWSIELSITIINNLNIACPEKFLEDFYDLIQKYDPGLTVNTECSVNPDSPFLFATELNGMKELLLDKNTKESLWLMVLIFIAWTNGLEKYRNIISGNVKFLSAI